MERKPVINVVREETISDLKLRLHDLRKEGRVNTPEFLLLQKAAKIERNVLEARSSDVSNYFYTGYAGRRVILWNYMDGKWDGQLCNRNSGVVKKQSVGDSAEEMLRGLMTSD